MKSLSNSQMATRRIYVVLGLIVLCMVAALFGWYPTNYEQLFTPLNGGIVAFGYLSLIAAVILLVPNIKIPGEKTISNLSFLHLSITLGIACAFFSWTVDTTYISATGTDRTPHAVIMFLYGPWEWVMFLPFILVEIYDSIKGLPKWLTTIKTYVSAISMMLAISISLMAGCTTIPRIINTLWGVEISPFLMMVPIACLVGFSVMKGIHKGMKVFSNITMTLMYVLMGTFLVLGIGKGVLGNTFNLFEETYSNFFGWMSYSGSELDRVVVFPYFIWGLTWIPIISTFIRKISEGRSLRSVILFLTVGNSIICQLYAAISYTAFGIYGENGNGMGLFNVFPVIGILYVIMLLGMFVTSADSTCFSIDELISKGAKSQISYRKLLWVLVMCAFVSVLLIAGSGSLDAIYGLSYIMAPLLVLIGLISIGIIAYRYFKNYDWKSLAEKIITFKFRNK